MTDLKPKPFHVGTRVHSVHDQPISDGVVAWCFVDPDEGNTKPSVLWIPDDGPVWHDPPEHLVHADGTAPLGEWEPIDWEAHPQFVFAFDPEVREDAQRAINAILRGEDPQ